MNEENQDPAVDRSLILENKTTLQILNTIRLNPGLHFGAICREVKKDRRTVRAHVEVLKSFEHIRSETIGKTTVYFESSLGKDADVFLCHLQKRDSKEIFKILLEEPGITMHELQERLEHAIPRSSLYRKVNTLIDRGCLSELHDETDCPRFEIPARYRPVLEKYL